ncbi:hypothetical protein ILP92_10595 [Maribius pontilimi]|uniref:Flagellar assembly protein FliH n=1 Tax=Palleronia pontilimi TaxID=1964209 RepID=A0A934IA06_9RHOB|nr:hypothetical protein [Palleronia pontilimi]MBJ3763193.1 hypothetical protein [Palleronia pontilimi]
MTARALELEDFDRNIAGFGPETDQGGGADPDRMASFDEGYAAGWEDAETATRGEQDQAHAAMRAHLQDLSFTYHEARAHVMRGLQPLLVAIVRQAVPDILQKTLGQRLIAEVEAMAEDVDGTDMELLVAPGQAAAANDLLDGITALPFAVAEDPTLAEGEIHLRMGAREREIDLNALRDGLDDALQALDTLNKETLANG